MTEIEWYFELNKRASEIFDKLQEHLMQLNTGEQKHYFSFHKRAENSFEFMIGHHKLLLTYAIGLKELTSPLLVFPIHPQANYHTSIRRRLVSRPTAKPQFFKLLTFVNADYISVLEKVVF